MSKRCPVRSQAGQASVEWALVLPVFLLLIMGGVQVALWAHAAHVATAAAQEGLVAARAAGGTAEAGEARASAVLAQLGPNLIGSPRVSATRSVDRASVEVSGYSTVVIPGLRLRVHGQAASVVERFVPEDER